MAKIIIWCPKDGPPRNIKYLSDTHLLNLIRYLEYRDLMATKKLIELEATRRVFGYVDYPELILKGLHTGRGAETDRLYVIETNNQEVVHTLKNTSESTRVETSAEYLERIGKQTFEKTYRDLSA